MSIKMPNEKKIISFSLWGNNPKYTIGAIKNLKLSKFVYPGWICRFYIGDDVSLHIIEQLGNAEIIRMVGEPCNWGGLYWRFLAASDLNVGIMISRDTDSRLNLREKSAVDEWLKSNKDFHLMRDHNGGHRWKIQGGMWGVRNGLLLNMSDLIKANQRRHEWGSDQNFLDSVVYPQIRHSLMVHDEKTNLRHLDPSRPFLIKTGNHFVGEIIDENDNFLAEIKNTLRVRIRLL